MTDFRTGELRLFPTQLRLSHLHRKAALAGALALSCCLLARVGFAKAAPGFGNLRGIIRSAQGTPLPGAQVRVHCVNDNTDRNIVANDQGAYLAENLRPARYKLVAVKDGMNSAEVTTVDLQPLEDLQVDMILYAAKSTVTVGANSVPDLRPPATGNSANDAPLTARERMLLERLDKLEQRLEAMEANQAKSAAVAVTAAQPAPAAPEPKTTATTTPAAPVPAGAPAKQYTTTAAAARPAPVTAASPRDAATAAPEKHTLLASLAGVVGIKSAEKPVEIPIQPSKQAAAPTAPAPQHVLPEALEAPDSAPPNSDTVYTLGRLYLVKRDPAQQRHRLGHEVLHSRSAIRHAFHGAISISPTTTRWAARRSRSAPVKFRWSRSASVVTSTGKTCAAGSCTWTACSPPPPRAMTPAPGSANGMSAGHINMFRRLMAGITSMSTAG